MMRAKRLICAALVLVMTLSMLCSCDMLAGDATEKIAEAEAALKNEPYRVELQVDLESDNAKMNEAIISLSEVKFEVLANGDDFKISMLTEVNGTKESYTRRGGKLYHEIESNGTKTGKELEYSPETVANLQAALGDGANVNPDDFSVCVSQTKKGTTIITYTDIKDETLNSLVSSMQAKLGADAFVAIKDASLTVQIVDGKYDITAFTCEYHLSTLEGEFYTLNLTYIARFTYEEVAITAPVI